MFTHQSQNSFKQHLRLGVIHLWRPHRGEGVRLKWTHVDGVGVKLHVDVHAEN